MSASHPQIRQRKQRQQLCRVLGQATEARLHITELALDHPERVFDLRPYLRLGFFDLALGFVQNTALAQFLVAAAPGGYLPDDLATFMLRALLHSGITGIGTDYVFVAVQQLIDLRDICHIGRRAHRPDSSSTPIWAFMPKYH